MGQRGFSVRSHWSSLALWEAETRNCQGPNLLVREFGGWGWHQHFHSLTFSHRHNRITMHNKHNVLKGKAVTKDSMSLKMWVGAEAVPLNLLLCQQGENGGLDRVERRGKEWNTFWLLICFLNLKRLFQLQGPPSSGTFPLPHLALFLHCL